MKQHVALQHCGLKAILVGIKNVENMGHIPKNVFFCSTTYEQAKYQLRLNFAQHSKYLFKFLIICSIIQ